MTTTKRFKHCWRKRIQISRKGIQLHDSKPEIPLHVPEDEWTLWWKVIATTIEEQLTSKRHGTSVFPTASCSELEVEFYGCPMGSMLTRMIFRNGYQNVDKFFIEKVMSHCVAVDNESYVKPLLMNGPWDIEPVAEEARSE